MNKRRVLLLAGSVLLLLGAGGSAVLHLLNSQESDMQQSLNRLATYEATMAARPQLEGELTKIQKESASLAGLVPGASTALATATVQNDVRAIVTGVDGEVRTSQNQPPSVDQGFEKIEIAYDFTVPLNRLK